MLFIFYFILFSGLNMKQFISNPLIQKMAQLDRAMPVFLFFTTCFLQSGSFAINVAHINVIYLFLQEGVQIQFMKRSFISKIEITLWLKCDFQSHGNFFLPTQYENFFIFSASYRSISKEYRLVSARWKPCLRNCFK